MADLVEHGSGGPSLTNAEREARNSTSDAPGGALEEFYSDLTDQGGEDGGDALMPRTGAPSARPLSGPSDVIGSHPGAAKHRAATLDNTAANRGRPKTRDASFGSRGKRPGR